MGSEKVPTSTNEQMSRVQSPQLTFIWVLQLRPVLCVYTCQAFRAVAAALGSLCCFPSTLAWHWPRLMVDWTWKHLAAFEEDVKLSACFPPVQASGGWQWWTDRWSCRPQHSKLNNPTWQPAERCWVVSGWVLGNEGPWVPHSQSSLSLCRSSVTPRLMRVYWGCCACLLSQNRAPNAKQQCASTVLPFLSSTSFSGKSF